MRRDAAADTILATVPDEIAGIAFLSGGQAPPVATANLAAMQEIDTPWPLTFSFGRALVNPALLAWRGDPGRIAEGQAALAAHVTRSAAVLVGSRSPV